MKSATDLHWSERAVSVRDDAEVNIMDVFQRSLEDDYISARLSKEMKVLEVGCGNGFSTAQFRGLVSHIDAFDYSEEMVRRAKARFGETNNRFFQDNVLDPQSIEDVYDVVLCVRVLINLRGLDEQQRAIRNMMSFARVGGEVMLVEGFKNGFRRLSELRGKIGLPPVEPSPINFYSDVDEVLITLRECGAVENWFHLGTYDYLSRVVYPMIVGSSNATHNTVFSEKCQQLARAFNPKEFEPFSRVRGFIITKVEDAQVC